MINSVAVVLRGDVDLVRQHVLDRLVVPTVTYHVLVITMCTYLLVISTCISSYWQMYICDVLVVSICTHLHIDEHSRNESLSLLSVFFYISICGTIDIP